MRRSRARHVTAAPRTWPGPALAGLLLTLLSGSAAVTLDPEPVPVLAACSGTGCLGGWPDTGGCAGGIVRPGSEVVEGAQCRAPFVENHELAAQPQYFFPVLWSRPDPDRSARGVRMPGSSATPATPLPAG